MNQPRGWWLSTKRLMVRIPYRGLWIWNRCHLFGSCLFFLVEHGFVASITWQHHMTTSHDNITWQHHMTTLLILCVQMTFYWRRTRPKSTGTVGQTFPQSFEQHKLAPHYQFTREKENGFIWKKKWRWNATLETYLKTLILILEWLHILQCNTITSVQYINTYNSIW